MDIIKYSAAQRSTDTTKQTFDLNVKLSFQLVGLNIKVMSAMICLQTVMARKDPISEVTTKQFVSFPKKICGMDFHCDQIKQFNLQI